MKDLGILYISSNSQITNAMLIPMITESMKPLFIKEVSEPIKAYEFLEKKMADLVVFGSYVGAAGGCEAVLDEIAKIRSDEAMKKIPIVVISSRLPPKEQHDIFVAGATLIVVKSHSSEEIIDPIVAILEFAESLLTKKPK